MSHFEGGNRRRATMPAMEFRAYDEDRDKDAVCRIWREAGWMEGDKTEAFDVHRAASRGLVAMINGEAECLVLTSPGTVRYLDEDLLWSCVSAVVTSRVARKQAFASRLTAQAIADDVAQGAIVSGLGLLRSLLGQRLGPRSRLRPPSGCSTMRILPRLAWLKVWIDTRPG